MQCFLNGLSVYKWQRRGRFEDSEPPTWNLHPFLHLFLCFPFHLVYQQQGLATNRKRFSFLLCCSKATVVVCLVFFLPICPRQAGGEELWSVQICHKDTQKEAGACEHMERGMKLGETVTSIP